jgi:DNA-binding GntR family transcriptional regulator
MRDQIRDVLVERILDGTYAAGTQLKEIPLAREFNVSQAPIREALRQLEGSGLVVSERFRGTRVRGTDFAEMRESYELRALLECRSLQIAAPYGPELVADLSEMLKMMESSLRAGNHERYIDFALRFHRRIIEAGGNRAFLNVWDSLLWDIRGRIVLRRFAQVGRSFRPILALHRGLIDSLRQNDTQQAVQRVEEILGKIAGAFSHPASPRAKPSLAARRSALAGAARKMA